ncbi:MAG: cation:dicarboxylate symporter family transporter [Phycisphaerae bacterium]
MRIKLHYLIFLGMAAGVVLGMLLWLESGLWDVRDPSRIRGTILWAFDLVGKTIFVGALRMLVAPLIFASIVAGVTSLPNMRELGNIGWKTFAYYVGTTSIAVLTGLALVLLIRPGHWEASRQIRQRRGAELAELRRELDQQQDARIAALPADMPDEQRQALIAQIRAEFEARLHARIRAREEAAFHDEAAREGGRLRTVEAARTQRTPGRIVRQTIAQILSNPFSALAENRSLGIIFFALLLGVGCTAVGTRAEPLARFFQAASDVIMRITVWIMMISPVAIMCLMASLVATHGPTVFQTLAGYVITVIGGIAIHVCVLLSICRLIGGRSPLELLRGIKEAWSIAFSTRSSAATLPVTMRCATENLQVDEKVSDFVLPIGATVNMDGTALYEGVAVIFLIQIYGAMPDVQISLGPVETVLIFVTAVLASIGAAAVPDAGLVTMVLVANAVGLPIYYLPLIFSVDAFLDMFRTSTNVMGDAIGSVVIDRLERPRLRPVAAGAPA